MSFNFLLSFRYSFLLFSLPLFSILTSFLGLSFSLFLPFSHPSLLLSLVIHLFFSLPYVFISPLLVSSSSSLLSLFLSLALLPFHLPYFILLSFIYSFPSASCLHSPLLVPSFSLLPSLFLPPSLRRVSLWKRKERSEFFLWTLLLDSREDNRSANSRAKVRSLFFSTARRLKKSFRVAAGTHTQAHTHTRTHTYTRLSTFLKTICLSSSLINRRKEWIEKEKTRLQIKDENHDLTSLLHFLFYISFPFVPFITVYKFDVPCVATFVTVICFVDVSFELI